MLSRLLWPISRLTLQRRRERRLRHCRFEQCEERTLLTFHLWKIDQVFSSADGKVQFIELQDPANGEDHTAGHFISSNENKFVFPTDLSTDATANKHFLIGTTSYAALAGAVKPDYVIPDNFFNAAGDSFDYADVDAFSFTSGQVPTDGVAAMFRDVNSGNLTTGKNSETNLAGQTGSVTVSSAQVNQPPTIDAIADPAAIPENAGAQTINLTGISAGAGQTETITITAASNNTALIPNPTVNYTSPNATGTLSYTPLPGAQGTATITVTVKNSGGTANGGSDTTVRTFNVHVTAPATPGLTITNNAAASDQPGTALTYTIKVTNNGSAAAAGATINDTLPSGLTNITAVDASGTVHISGSSVSDALGSLAAGASETLTITATPTAALNGSTVANAARLVFNGASQSAIASTTIGAPPPPPPPPPPAATGAGILNGTPGDGTPQTFLQNLYRELLGRESDSVGQAAWLQFLGSQNTPTGRAVVIQGFLNSSEYKTHFVTNLYEIFLGRAPEPSGLAFWIDKMGNPGTPGQNTASADEKSILAAFLGSDEYFLKSGGTTQGWLTAIYQDVFGRAPDSAGLQHWANQVALRGGRDGIARDILSSPEAARDVLNSFFPAAASPLGAPGTRAGAGMSELALLTGGGWENAYLQGRTGNSSQDTDAFFASLTSGGNWDDVQLQMLGSDRFFANGT